MLYRYEINGGGFLTEIESYFNENELLPLIAVFEDKLHAPNINMEDTISYFTKEGNRKFKKAILRCKKALSDIGVPMMGLQVGLEVNSNVVYRDKY